MSDRIRLSPPNERPAFRREWGCPLTKNRSPWCFRLCIPVAGHGECGRIAPHSLVGRTERAILLYKAEQEAAQRDAGRPDQRTGPKRENDPAGQKT